MASTTIVASGTLGNVKGASGGSASHHLVYATNSGRWWFFTWGGILSSGTATSGTTAQLVDTGKSWTASTYLGASCIITGGTGSAQAFEIGPNTSNTLQVYNNGVAATLATAPASGSTYDIVETRYIKAYVSSGSDLSTATWAEATGSPSPILPNSSGLDVSAGRNDGGWAGDLPSDGRILTVGYNNVASVDVALLMVWENLHWLRYSERARLGIGTPSTIAWDLTGPVTWQDSWVHNEMVPMFPMAAAIGVSSTKRWHVIKTEGGLPNSGIAAHVGVVDDGTNNKNLGWGGTYVDIDSISTMWGWVAELAALGSGFMLAVYGNGTNSGSGVGASHQTGLRWQESISESAWTTTAAGATVPNLSTASNHPNDWAMVARTTSDVHVVRRNAATTFEHVRYSGHSGSWGSLVTLPSSGLTGHQQGSGIAMVSDGTTVWCIVIDTDANHSIRYIKWTSGAAWDASWSTLTTDTNAKDFVTATMGTTQIGVAWTVGASTPFAVATTPLVLTSPGFKDVQARYRLVVPTTGFKNTGARYVLAPPVSVQPWERLRPTTGSLM